VKSRSKYPRTIWRKFKADDIEDPIYKNCVICGKKFAKGESIAVKETQYSWFRGDDDIEMLCMKCLPTREKRKPESLRIN
jgi:hypothetical protein